MKTTNDKYSQREKKPLSDRQLEGLFSEEMLRSLSLANFGGVMIANDVYTGKTRLSMLLREQPDPGMPFSGWTFFSGTQPVDTRELQFHDCLAILKIAPEVSKYLHLPPETALMRTGEYEFTII